MNEVIFRAYRYLDTLPKPAQTYGSFDAPSIIDQLVKQQGREDDLQCRIDALENALEDEVFRADYLEKSLERRDAAFGKIREALSLDHDATLAEVVARVKELVQKNSPSADDYRKAMHAVCLSGSQETETVELRHAIHDAIHAEAKRLHELTKNTGGQAHEN